MTHELRLFNTLSAQVEALTPLAPPEVRFYACGPTVYDRAHVGNFRSFVATDVLRRTLKHLGYRVREVMNLTDVDDRIIQKAQAAGKDLRRLHRRVHPGLRGGHGARCGSSGRSTCPARPTTSRR